MPLGRDLINELPKLKTNLDNMKEPVDTMTNEVKFYLSKINRERKIQTISEKST